MIDCRKCGEAFEPTAYQMMKHDYLCLPCRRKNDCDWRARRKAAGRPVYTPKMPRDWHQKYEEAYRQRPEVRAKVNERARKRMRDPGERPKHEARWQVSRAIASGRIVRQPCRVCGTPKSQAHHTDYSKPLDVEWLCAVHHAAEHKAEGRTP